MQTVCHNRYAPPPPPPHMLVSYVQTVATTPNNTQKDMQTEATCNIQQCWELFANNVASVCTGL